MAANGISTLPTKEAKQIAKLDLAAIDRAASGKTTTTYDRDLLPAKYVGDTAVPSGQPLQPGRPWV